MVGPRRHNFSSSNTLVITSVPTATGGLCTGSSLSSGYKACSLMSAACWSSRFPALRLVSFEPWVSKRDDSLEPLGRIPRRVHPDVVDDIDDRSSLRLHSNPLVSLFSPTDDDELGLTLILMTCFAIPLPLTCVRVPLYSR
jgi:hypothetical protein